ncbi:MAG TPA: hypothetical protein PLN68_09825 [Elusimicrobiales bacterium]|nr:hypothetical protein [Elusimicrobiales bacterium]
MKFILILFSVLMSAQDKKLITNSSVNEINSARNTLNTDMDAFSKEFLNGDNSHKLILDAQNDIINAVQNAAQKDVKKNNDLTENLKILEKETDDTVVTEVDIPNLNPRKTYVNVKGKDVFLNYEKKDFIETPESFKKKNKFVKKIKISEKADPSTLKYRISDNRKVIITFKKRNAK